MQQPGRSYRGRDDSQSMIRGGFPEPFAGYGGHRSNGLFNDAFDNDPFFRDPFFSRGFGAPFGAGGLFGPSGYFSSGMFGMGEGNSRPMERSYGTPHGTPYGTPYGTPVVRTVRENPIEDGNKKSTVQIEELPNDHDLGVHWQQEPIVELPDDDEEERTERVQNRARSGGSASSGPRSRRQSEPSSNNNNSNWSRRQSEPSRQPQPSSSNNYSNNNTPVRSYGFQRSSVMYGGSNGQYSYQSSSVVYGPGNGQYYSPQTTRRQGPDVVQNVQIEGERPERQDRDTATGRENLGLLSGTEDTGRSGTVRRNSRGLGDKLGKALTWIKSKLSCFC